MTKELWEHQKRDIAMCVSAPKGVFNTSDPGTGKTRVCIEAIRQLNVRTLVLAPKSILQCAWGNDLDEFAPDITYAVATASNRAAAFASGAQVVITNHDAIKWLNKEGKRYLKDFEGGLMIVDESTCYKNPDAQRSKAAASVRPYFSRCFCMSGTPTPQGIIDLWHQVFLVDMGELLGGSYYRFRNMTYTGVIKGGFTDWVEKPGVSDAVADIIAPITIRNKRDDCMDLPPNHIIKMSVNLTPSHMQKYQTLKKQSIVELESGDVNAVNAAALLGKLLQLASGAVYDEFGEAHLVDTARYTTIMDLVDERDHSVVVFNWRHQRDELVKIAEARNYAYGIIDGSVSAEGANSKRTQIIQDFQDRKLKCMFIHPKSASHGITLTAGMATIWASPTYNAEYFEQANARIYRGGQTRSTETILISAPGTAEPQVYDALFEKRLKMTNLLEML